MPTRSSMDPVVPRSDARARAPVPRTTVLGPYRSLLVLTLAAATACSGDATPTTPDPQPPTVLLKDVVVANLPAPYYHFEYDPAGRVAFVSFASELTRYDVRYAGGRISEMQNNILVNKDRLVYAYDEAGRVREVTYADSLGAVYARVRYTYAGPKLVGVERARQSESGFAVEKTTSLAYDAEGNLSVLTVHRPAVAGVQDEMTYADHFAQYDAGTNVDGFDLLHDDFFDHLVLLPDVHLQKGNPGKQTRTGDGINFTVDFSYAYDDRNRPVSKSGELTIQNGTDSGRVVHLSSQFTYY